MGSKPSMIRPQAETSEPLSFAARHPARIPFDGVTPTGDRRPPVAVILADLIEIQLLLESLHDVGAPVVSTNNGIAGLRLIETERPSIIVVDLCLQGLSGLEVLRRRPQGIPAILAADFTSPALRVEAVAARALALVVRPFDPAALSQQLNPYVHWVPRAGSTVWAVDAAASSRPIRPEPLQRSTTRQ